MCDLDNYPELEEYDVISDEQLRYRRSLGHDISFLGTENEFVGEGEDRMELVWDKYYDHTSDERLRVETAFF